MPTRVLRQAPGIDGRALASLVSAEAWRSHLLKREGDTIVARGPDPAGRLIVLKQMRLLGLRSRLASLLGRSRLARQWRGGRLLMQAGIACAAPYALIRRGRTEMLMLCWVDGPTVAELAVQRGLSVGFEQEVARAIGANVAALVRAGLFNRDHKASNLVVHEHGADHAIVLIDTVGISRRPGRGLTMLAKVLIELIGIGACPRATLRMRALHTALNDGAIPPGISLKQAWRAIDAILRAHGDPRPSVSPVPPPM